jgi:nicotinamidase-related amidase
MEKYYLNKEEAVLLIIDIQEKLMPAIKNSEMIIDRNKILAETAKTMNMPILVTEQYPKGLGSTVSELEEGLDGAVKYEKATFTGCSKELLEYLQETNRKKIIVTGTETHVCVYQTVRDLLNEGYFVFLVEDAVGSRTKENYDNSISLMRDMGAVISNTETIVFDLLKKSGTVEFKALMKLIK